MSRCYPYPPPGYALRRSSEEGFVKSIKLRKGTEKTKDEKKEKRREKKERKNEKKEKRSHGEGSKHKKLAESTSASVHTETDGIPLLNKKIEFVPKAEEVEKELLERSSLTEEHCLPVSLLAPSTSSDSTENSKKRKRESPPTDVTRPRGNVIRIRLQPKKQIECDVAPVNERKELLPCSSIKMVDTRNHTRARESVENVCSTSDINKGLSSLKSRLHETVASPIDKLEPPASVPKSSPVLTAVQREQLLYTNLIENWTPPSKLQEDSYLEEDLDWLFSGGKKQNKQPSVTTRRCGNDSAIAFSSSVLQPRAQYLPEVDIFALPYTVPF